ncbi:hypothetical protein HAZT_HAZT002325 [Hyalella azteca]|uniref:Phenazine biosynthesis-like domain-containing protein n=1 Tax=Hyalella azteca TaxID=294128 RepID=A0A6A0GUH3_HYAAZ|nr:hypothetical protein HAZT_HAZT002325 [Hyalella azteca]
MQKIATEFNLSETAYLTPLPEAGTCGDRVWSTCGKFGLRWFTPLNEVPLCGHATLAAAHALISCLGNSCSKFEFETLSGTLVARKDSETQKITLDFPNYEPVPLSDHHADLATLVKLVEEQLPVQDVRVSLTARKLIVRIKDSCTRSGIQC